MIRQGAIRNGSLRQLRREWVGFRLFGVRQVRLDAFGRDKVRQARLVPMVMTGSNATWQARWDAARQVAFGRYRRDVIRQEGFGGA